MTALMEECLTFLEFETDDVQRALNSFPRKSGAGRTGLSPQHLKDAISCKSPVVEDRFLGKLTRVVNLLVAGEAATEALRSILTERRCILGGRAQSPWH